MNMKNIEARDLMVGNVFNFAGMTGAVATTVTVQESQTTIEYRSTSGIEGRFQTMNLSTVSLWL